MIADSVTVSRILFSLALFAFAPSSPPFGVCYLLCGVTDALDGVLARKLHTASRIGERLDSIADLFFAAVYAAKILPFLRLPVWILIWTALIAAVKIFGILKRSKKERRFRITHSPANKLTGLLLFLLPLTAGYGAIVVCAVATEAAIEEIATS